MGYAYGVRTRPDSLRPALSAARSSLGALLVLSSLGACSGTADEPATRREHVSTEATSEPRARREPERLRSIDDVPALPPATYAMPARIVAIGDVHGDVSAFRQVLRTAGAIDLADHWSGGALVVVQNGDLLDRGDDEPEILALVSQLEREAEAAGGHFLALNGNHELMNAQLDFRYVTDEGFEDFDRYREEISRDARSELPRRAHGRGGAFEPRSHFARQFAARNTVVVVGDTVFVHGGVTPAAARLGLDTINRAARDFFLGVGPLSSILASEEGHIDWLETQLELAGKLGIQNYLQSAIAELKSPES